MAEGNNAPRRRHFIVSEGIREFQWSKHKCTSRKNAAQMQLETKTTKTHSIYKNSRRIAELYCLFRKDARVTTLKDQ